MDYSAVASGAAADTHQQQYQHLQSHHHQQPQDQQPYDPAQAYDAYYAYYNQQQQYDSSAHHPQQYDASAYHQQQHYDALAHQPPAYQQHYDASAYNQYLQQYYSQDYAAAYHQQQPVTQPESALPSQIPQPQGGEVGGHGYPPEHQSSYPMPGLNPAAATAVAALSQLTQFAEHAMQQERHWHAKSGGMMGSVAGGPYPQHPYPPHPYMMSHDPTPMHPEGRMHRGGGWRGGAQFRGTDPQSFRQDGGAQASRGRGHGGRRGRGGGRQFNQSSESQPPSTASASTKEPKSVQAAASVSEPPRNPLLPVAWCDICRVDCNRLEILEQHKNGKRHKKTVQRLEEMQARQKQLAEIEAKETAERSEKANTLPKLLNESQSETTEQPDTSDQGAEENQGAQGNEDDMQIAEHQNHNIGKQLEEKEVEAASEKQSMQAPGRKQKMDVYNRRNPLKRKIARCGRGGKKLRYFESMCPKPQERHPKEQPWVCTLCNVVCDTGAVFERHLAGKKHTSKVKHFHGQESQSGPAANPIPPNYLSAYTPQTLQPSFHGLQPPGTSEQVSLPAFSPHFMPSYGQAYHPCKAGQDAAAVSEPLAAQNVQQAKTEGPAYKNVSAECKNVEGVVIAPEYGVSSSELVVLPGLDV